MRAKPNPLSEALLAELATRDLLEQLHVVCRKYHLLLEELWGKGREAHVVAARREVWRHLSDLGWNSTAIGRLFGKDPSTVSYALNPDGSEA